MKLFKLKYRSLGLTLLAVSLMLGCHKVTVTNAPQGVVAGEVGAWYQATGAVNVWSSASLSLTNSAITLHTAGVFPSEDVYQKTLAALAKENQIGLEATHYLQSVPQHFDTTAQGKLAGYVDQGLASLDDATQVGVLQIKDSTTKAVIDASITSLRSSLKTIFALSEPAGTPVPAALQ